MAGAEPSRGPDSDCSNNGPRAASRSDRSRDAEDAPAVPLGVLEHRRQCRRLEITVRAQHEDRLVLAVPEVEPEARPRLQTAERVRRDEILPCEDDRPIFAEA